ncbi:MAG TPA: DUF1127 domain-containing protein [Geminicoccaceae bacterium]|nr:DUF1127 domain-containing protein [Geminicoccaceae bacterium]
MIASGAKLHEGMSQSRTSITTRQDAGLLETVLTLVGSWYRVWQDRRQLAQLPDHMLRDIGLTRADVEREALQPFWQPIDYATLERQRRRTARQPWPGA